jgi:hypothetical protein
MSVRGAVAFSASEISEEWVDVSQALSDVIPVLSPVMVDGRASPSAPGRKPLLDEDAATGCRMALHDLANGRNPNHNRTKCPMTTRRHVETSRGAHAAASAFLHDQAPERIAARR